MNLVALRNEVPTGVVTVSVTSPPCSIMAKASVLFSVCVLFLSCVGECFFYYLFASLPVIPDICYFTPIIFWNGVREILGSQAVICNQKTYRRVKILT